jgi:Domain of unknown function (DUF5658)
MVVVAADVGEPLPALSPDAEPVRERRATRTVYPGPDRRLRPAPRLEARGAGLAVVHTCPACGRFSIVPYVPGAAITAGSACSCAAPAAAAAVATAAPVAAATPIASVAVPGVASALHLQAIVVTGALVALWILNLEDVILTRRALGLGAIELNAVMGFFLRFGFAPAAVIKMSIVTAGSLFLWTQRRRRIVLLASLGLAAVYVALVVYQLAALAG